MFRGLILASVLAFSANSASALTAADVQAAMLARAAESQLVINDLQAQFVVETDPAARQMLGLQIRAENARRMQLISFARIVPRYPASRLPLVVARYGLSVSPSTP